MQFEVYRAAPHFVVEMKRVQRRSDLVNFQRSFSLCLRIVKFKLSIAAIRYAHKLLRAPLQFIVQDDGLSDFLHGLAHLLALSLHRAIRIFLADFHLALQDSLRALY